MDELYYSKRKSGFKKDMGRSSFDKSFKNPMWEGVATNTVALNNPLSYIYAMTKEKVNYLISFKAKINPEPRRGNEYCAYHQTNGHKTYECRVLAGIIHKLIREGHLKEYIKDNSEAI